MFEVPNIGKVVTIASRCCNGCVFNNSVCSKGAVLDLVGHCFYRLRDNKTNIKFLKIY